MLANTSAIFSRQESLSFVPSSFIPDLAPSMKDGYKSHSGFIDNNFIKTT